MHDVHHEPGYVPTPLTSDVRSELVVPLLVDGELYGVINIEEVSAAPSTRTTCGSCRRSPTRSAPRMRSAAPLPAARRAYLGTAEALAAALAAKDAYTADHARSIATRPRRSAGGSA